MIAQNLHFWNRNGAFFLYPHAALLSLRQGEDFGVLVNTGKDCCFFNYIFADIFVKKYKKSVDRLE